RAYCTGDLGVIRGGGGIECLGRRDHQVKLRGYRIELEEIERALMRIDGVREAVVVMREEAGEKRLIGYIVNDEKEGKNERESREELKKELPEYMAPAVIMRIEKLPLTPNGKIDRRGLPSPEGKRFELQGAYEPPRTKTELKIAQVWEELLKVRPI